MLEVFGDGGLSGAGLRAAAVVSQEGLVRVDRLGVFAVLFVVLLPLLLVVVVSNDDMPQKGLQKAAYQRNRRLFSSHSPTCVKIRLTSACV